MFITYAIYNNKNKIYIGFTRDLKKRLERHNSKLPNKKSSFTSKNPGTWKILHIERFLTEKEARKKEKALKSAQGRKFLKGKIYDIK